MKWVHGKGVRQCTWRATSSVTLASTKTASWKVCLHTLTEKINSPYLVNSGLIYSGFVTRQYSVGPITLTAIAAWVAISIRDVVKVSLKRAASVSCAVVQHSTQLLMLTDHTFHSPSHTLWLPLPETQSSVNSDFPQPQVTYILFKTRITMIFLLIMILTQTGNKNVKCWIGNWFLPSTMAHPSHLIHFTRTLCLIFYILDNWTFEDPLILLWQGLTVSVIEWQLDFTYKEIHFD